MLILEMCSGMIETPWTEVYDEFRNETTMKKLQSDFSDLLTILICADKVAFPSHFEKPHAMAYLGHLYFLFEGILTTFGKPNNDDKEEKEKEGGTS